MQIERLALAPHSQIGQFACRSRLAGVTVHAQFSRVEYQAEQGQRHTKMPKAKKHLIPMENNRPARPMMAKASPSKSQHDGLYLLACAFSRKPCRQAFRTDATHGLLHTQYYALFTASIC